VQSNEKTPRFTKTSTDHSESNPSSSEGEENNGIEPVGEGVSMDELVYQKAKEKEEKRIAKKVLNGKWKVEERLNNPLALKNVSQCSICYHEVPNNARLSYLAEYHDRQHERKLYHHCLYCEQPFLFQHQLNVHLEELR
jgi:hypothetical protein